jgi:threonine/homoserine/homoserine lactone efflux protein
MPAVTEALLAAVGIALSPFAVIPAVLLLFTRRPGATSGGFAAGWACGVALVTTAAVLLADLLTLPDAPPRWATWARIVLGGLLIVYGLGKVLRASAAAEPPGWMRSLDQSTPRSASRLGLLASGANPKVALLAVAGGFSLGGDLQGPAAEVTAVLGFTLLAASTALAPALGLLLLGDRILRPLGAAKDRLTARADVIVAVVLVVIGAALLWKGVGAL